MTVTAGVGTGEAGLIKPLKADKRCCNLRIPGLTSGWQGLELSKVAPALQLMHVFAGPGEDLLHAACRTIREVVAFVSRRLANSKWPRCIRGEGSRVNGGSDSPANRKEPNRTYLTRSSRAHRRACAQIKIPAIEFGSLCSHLLGQCR